MVYQEDLRAAEVRAIWVGDLRHEDALVTYLNEAFQEDFGVLLDDEDDDGAPEFTYSFESKPKPPDLNNPARVRTSCAPFDRHVDVRKLMAGFSNSGGWVEDAVRQCHAKGISVATVAVSFGNLRYRPELCRNANAPLRFIGNV